MPYRPVKGHTRRGARQARLFCLYSSQTAGGVLNFARRGKRVIV